MKFNEVMINNKEYTFKKNQSLYIRLHESKG